MEDLADRQQILQLLQNWGFWRDDGDWERLATTFHEGGTIEVTWFKGTFTDFIAGSKQLRKKPRLSKHLIGGSKLEIRGDRAVAETNVTIMGRQTLHDVEVDSTAIGRFHDLLEKRAGRWAVVRRVAIYEKDRLDPVDPAAVLKLDAERLKRYPPAYRHLGYALSVSAGTEISPDLPVPGSAALDRVRAEGDAWLAGR